MTSVASRDLRNHTADVLRQVAEGTRVTVTVNGEPVAEIGPVTTRRKTYLSRAELVDIVTRHPADRGLAAELDRLTGELVDDSSSA